MVAFTLEKGAQAVIIIALARILGATEYGRLTLAQGMVNTAQLFVVLGAGTILARYIPAMLEESFARAVEIINLCALVIIATAIIFTLIGIVGAHTTAVSLLGLPAHSLIPYWIIGWVLLTAFNGLLMTVMLSLEKGQAIGIVSLAVALATIIIVPFAAIKWGFHGAVIALVITGALKASLLFRYYIQLLRAQQVSLWIPARRSDVPLLLSFGLPVFLSSALWAPTMWLAQIILKQSSSMGLSSVGVFGFCNNILGLVILISSITNRAAFPILSSLKARDDHREIKKFVRSIFLIQTAGAVIVGGPIAVFSPYIMNAMGPGFATGEYALIAMVAAGIIVSGQQPFINLLLVSDRAFINLIGMGIWSISLLSLSFALISFGAFGVACAVLIAAVIKGAFVALVIMSARNRSRNTI